MAQRDFPLHKRKIADDNITEVAEEDDEIELEKDDRTAPSELSNKTNELLRYIEETYLKGMALFKKKMEMEVSILLSFSVKWTLLRKMEKFVQIWDLLMEHFLLSFLDKAFP